MPRWSVPARSAAEAAQRAGFARWMEGYWAAAQAWWEAAEAATALYASELREYVAGNPRPLLREHMIARGARS